MQTEAGRDRVGLALVALLAACGKPLAPVTYVGTPRFQLSVLVNGSSRLIDPAHPALRGTLLWLSQGPLVPVARFSDLVEQPSNATDLPAFGDGTWNLFDLPEAKELVTTASGATYGLARLVVYNDQNGNGAWDPSEPVVGLAPANLLLWSPADLSAADSPTGLAVPAGFHAVSKPIACHPRPPPPPGTDDCGAHLGAQCGGATGACGTATCLIDVGLPWPGGYCATPIDLDGGCRPAGSVAFHLPQHAGDYWTQGCRTDDDCSTRDAAYQCDLAYGACLPTRGIKLVLSDVSAPISVCEPPPP